MLSNEAKERLARDDPWLDSQKLSWKVTQSRSLSVDEALSETRRLFEACLPAQIFEAPLGTAYNKGLADLQNPVMLSGWRGGSLTCNVMAGI